MRRYQSFFEVFAIWQKPLSLNRSPRGSSRGQQLVSNNFQLVFLLDSLNFHIKSSSLFPRHRPLAAVPGVGPAGRTAGAAGRGPGGGLLARAAGLRPAAPRPATAAAAAARYHCRLWWVRLCYTNLFLYNFVVLPVKFKWKIAFVLFVLVGLKLFFLLREVSETFKSYAQRYWILPTHENI